MSKAFTERVRFARALQSKPFALLWTGQTISAIGDRAYYTALAWEVLLITSSATAMGIVLIAGVLPTVVFVLIGGVVADRLPRRLVMLWSDTCRAIVVLLIATLGWAHLLQFWHLVVLALIFGIADSFFQPAYQAIPPQLVDIEMLPSANALTVLSLQLSQLIGPAIGAFCVALAGPVSGFAFDGLTFIISATCLTILRLPASGLEQPLKAAIITETESSPTSLRQHFHTLTLDIREGLGYVAGSTWLWATILIASIGNIAYGAPRSVTLPRLIHDVYGYDVWLLGLIATTGAIGSILATVVIGQMSRRGKRGLFAYACLILASLTEIVFGLPLPHALTPLIACAASAVAGAGIGAFEITWITVMQELVPSEKLGRVFSIDLLGSLFLLPIGYGIVGILSDHLGPSLMFISGGILFLVLSITGLCIRGIRQLA